MESTTASSDSSHPPASTAPDLEEAFGPPGDTDYAQEPYYQNMQGTSRDSTPISTPVAELLDHPATTDGQLESIQTTVAMMRAQPLAQPETHQPEPTSELEIAILPIQKVTQETAQTSQLPPALQIADRPPVLPERMVTDTVDQGVVVNHLSPGGTPYMNLRMALASDYTYPALQPASRPGDHLASGMGTQPRTFYSEYSDCDSEISSNLHTVLVESHLPRKESKDAARPPFMGPARAFKPRPPELPIRQQDVLTESDKENVDTIIPHREKAPEPPQRRPMTEKSLFTVQGQRMDPPGATGYQPMTTIKNQPPPREGGEQQPRTKNRWERYARRLQEGQSGGAEQEGEPNSHP